ncbi:hypothetical protein [Salinimicrobium tongyeongense]|uniref:hypothetical protein n=1 Tax=Salinimicrobium tongyeongense TaxID=2809707 RepID=UPI0022366F1C|nr:hypothetical protein [Salinimicrobium tongyeongense]
MKIQHLLFILLTSLVNNEIFAQQSNEWENPLAIDRNKLEGRSDFILFKSASKALGQEKESSSLYQSLNGKWKFQLVKHPSERPLIFIKKIWMTVNGIK